MRVNPLPAVTGCGWRCPKGVSGGARVAMKPMGVAGPDNRGPAVAAVVVLPHCFQSP
jgi:hypothetical protein